MSSHTIGARVAGAVDIKYQPVGFGQIALGVKVGVQRRVAAIVDTVIDHSHNRISRRRSGHTLGVEPGQIARIIRLNFAAANLHIIGQNLALPFVTSTGPDIRLNIKYFGQIDRVQQARDGHLQGDICKTQHAGRTENDAWTI